MKERFDVGIIGAGVLGVSLAFWLSHLSDCSIALIDQEGDVAVHTSSRNTGVVHRPFYLNPEKKRLFARAAAKSYHLWKSLAKQYELPWQEYGTLEVATDESQIEILHKYREWAIQNGMEEDEAVVLDGTEVSRTESQVHCKGAIYSKKDTAVDYGIFTHCLSDLARKTGSVEFLGNSKMIDVKEDPIGIALKVRDSTDKRNTSITCGFLINTAGGGAIDIAHKMDLAAEYTDLHFRGEYWIVEDNFGKSVTRNIYSVARHQEFPFLDPHFILRVDGRREVGPNAVLVAGPAVYSGLSNGPAQLLEKIFERPNSPKWKLFTNSQFLSLVWHEWRSSISKTQMCERVRRFIPSLESNLLKSRGLAGVRSSVIDGHGFVPEAILVEGKRSLHILNYNSPGATGAPSYSAYIVNGLFRSGFVARNKSVSSSTIPWDFETAIGL